jgi:DNA mismatch endonuclease (patch repair protein)
MSRVRLRDTKPELAVRKLLFAMGYRYRLHVGSLPGKPDMVFPVRRKIVFVHGCFWHRHATESARSRVCRNRPKRFGSVSWRAIVCAMDA